MIIAVPFLLYIDKILIIWLGEIPPFAATFTSFLIISSVIGSLTNGFDAFVLATGKVKLMQIGYVITNFIQLPIVYIIYYMGGTPFFNVLVMVFMTCVSVLYQIFVISKVSNFNVFEYIKVTILPILKVLIFVLHLFLIRVNNDDMSFIQLVIYCSIVLVILGIVILFVGMDKTERKFVMQLILKK